ncbi:MAG: DUF2254 domain-containing protein [Gemmatimonadaceae bacterium]
MPSIIVTGSIALAIGMIELSTRVDADALARWPLIFGATPDSSREILSAIASGMITVAGLTFSLTIVAVTQASSQFTPRILRNFMNDRPNQVVLGTFVGIFTYCLIVMRTIRSVQEHTFVPSLAVVLGILLAILGVAVLIYFVHHIASTLQSSSIVVRVADDAFRAIDLLFPHDLSDPSSTRTYDDSIVAARGAPEISHWRAISSPNTGYVQGIDVDALVRLACDTGRVIRMEHGPGDFVIADTPLASVSDGTARHSTARDASTVDEWPKIKRRVARAYTTGKYRTVDEDVAFALRQLVDISLRALSPGVNDTTTAVTCVDHIGAILVRLAPRRIDCAARVVDGELRVLVRGPTFESLLRLAVDEIRQNSGGNVGVLARTMEMLMQLASCTITPDRLELIREQVVLVEQVASRTVPAEHDRDRLCALAARAQAKATTTPIPVPERVPTTEPYAAPL